MNATAVLRRATFKPEQEARYILQLLGRAVIIARVGCVAGAISFIAYGGWDLYLDSESLSATGPLRLATAASFGLVIGATYWHPKKTAKYNIEIGRKRYKTVQLHRRARP